MTEKAPTVICLEDLHWADATFLDFLRSALLHQGPTSLTLCTYRPPLKLFSKEEISRVGEGYLEIQLQDLSQAEAQEMVVSILGTETIPTEMRRYIQEKVGGNPFYLEEMVNSLIELGTLEFEDGCWKLTRAIVDSDIPPTIHCSHFRQDRSFGRGYQAPAPGSFSDRENGSLRDPEESHRIS